MPKEKDTEQGRERELLKDLCKYAKVYVYLYTQMHKL